MKTQHNLIIKTCTTKKKWPFSHGLLAIVTKTVAKLIKKKILHFETRDKKIVANTGGKLFHSLHYFLFAFKRGTIIFSPLSLHFSIKILYFPKINSILSFVFSHPKFSISSRFLIEFFEKLTIL